MVREDIRSMLHYDSVVFDNPSFDDAIIGMTFDGCAIYELNRMIESLMIEDECSYEDAISFIEYNTFRTLPYISGKRPIIVEEME